MKRNIAFQNDNNEWDHNELHGGLKRCEHSRDKSGIHSCSHLPLFMIPVATDDNALGPSTGELNAPQKVNYCTQQCFSETANGKWVPRVFYHLGALNRPVYSKSGQADSNSPGVSPCQYYLCECSSLALNGECIIYFVREVLLHMMTRRIYKCEGMKKTSIDEDR